jgi:hypothetical protein
MFNWYPIAGLLLGTALRVLVPYVRAGFELVTETGSFADWPTFDWRYLALFAMPVIEFGVAFLTLNGLWNAAQAWEFIPAVSMAYAGADIGREVVGTVAAVYRAASR